MRRFITKTRKHAIRYSIVAANTLLLVAVVLFVVNNPNSSTAVQQNALTGANTVMAASPLDELSSAEIAVHVAKMAQLSEVTEVVNEADTVNAQLSITPADDKVIAKPQIVATALKTKKDIQKYAVVQGDTIASIAQKFSVTSDSIKWSNQLTSNTVPVGRVLLISPVSNGIVYTVKQGDTPDALAQRYNANKDEITSFNDAEQNGLKPGELIVIPNGSVQSARSTRTASGGTSFSWGGVAPIYSGNGYARGYCTWWAAYRRGQVGRPIPSNFGNAVTWKVLSQRAGLPGGTTPRAGAVIWFPMGGYGHVGFVESVSDDGTVNISDMNWSGWNRVTYRTIPPNEAGKYYYIY